MHGLLGETTTTFTAIPYGSPCRRPTSPFRSMIITRQHSKAPFLKPSDEYPTRIQPDHRACGRARVAGSARRKPARAGHHAWRWRHVELRFRDGGHVVWRGLAADGDSTCWSCRSPASTMMMMLMRVKMPFNFTVRWLSGQASTWRRSRPACQWMPRDSSSCHDVWKSFLDADVLARMNDSPVACGAFTARRRTTARPPSTSRQK